MFKGSSYLQPPTTKFIVVPTRELDKSERASKIDYQSIYHYGVASVFNTMSEALEWIKAQPPGEFFVQELSNTVCTETTIKPC